MWCKMAWWLPDGSARVPQATSTGVVRGCLVQADAARSREGVARRGWATGCAGGTSNGSDRGGGIGSAETGIPVSALVESQGDARRRPQRSLLRAVLFGMVHGRIVGVLLRVDLVTLSGVGVMRGLLVVAGLVVLGSLFVMLGGLLVVLGGLLVRFCGFLGHENSPFEERPARLTTSGAWWAFGGTLPPRRSPTYAYAHSEPCVPNRSEARRPEPVKRLHADVLAEHDENETQKSFTPSERVAIARAIEERIGKRQGQRTDLEPVQKLHKSSRDARRETKRPPELDGQRCQRPEPHSRTLTLDQSTTNRFRANLHQLVQS